LIDSDRHSISIITGAPAVSEIRWEYDIDLLSIGLKREMRIAFGSLLMANEQKQNEI
jgi:hypothetical protein